MFRFRAAIAAVCFLAVTCPALASSTGFVRGVVTEAGKPQAAASVTLAGEGSHYTTTTNSDGGYAFAAVPFGRYVLTVHKDGTTDRSVDVDVETDSVALANVDLLRTIAVTAVTATSGASGTPVAVTTLDRAQIQTSPVNTSLNRLIETVPGAVQF